MPEAKYTTQIYLAVLGDDPEKAGKSAVRVYQDFLGRLHHTAPTAKYLRLALDAPTARKGSEGVFECWSNLRAVVPGELTALGADNAKDAWRTILKSTFNSACHHNHDLVHHTSSRVEVTREVLAFDDAPVEVKKDDTPKEMIAVKVLLGGQEFNVEIPKGENLLDGVNDKGVAVKWDCKSGVCDTCKIKVESGMENLSPPNDNERNMLGDLINQGYRLSCQITANGPCQIKQ